MCCCYGESTARLTHALVILTRFLLPRHGPFCTVALPGRARPKGKQVPRTESTQTQNGEGGKRTAVDHCQFAQLRATDRTSRPIVHSEGGWMRGPHEGDNRVDHFLPPKHGKRAHAKTRCQMSSGRGDTRWQRRTTDSSQAALRRSSLKGTRRRGATQQLICQRNHSRHGLNEGRLSQSLR